ncbi:hypothetical protein Dsin_000967 [Dipteronia sinensis]|uniref:RNase H type-1 domain-containing protein n=1 Tax=Dipteronia sinensis TaxID=43782 RepID=A0AAE0EI00_9ROSI|nr:hypothetical protein Dsin_000967 [Dipteronia sinensis]
MSGARENGGKGKKRYPIMSLLRLFGKEFFGDVGSLRMAADGGHVLSEPFEDCIWWLDVALLKENFLSDDVIVILSIPCSEECKRLKYIQNQFDFLKGKHCEDVGAYLLAVVSLVGSQPDEGCFKINIDAALDIDGYVVGFGLVVRNSHGLVVALSVQRVIASFCSLTAETMAILRGINFAIDLGVRPVVIESDALAAIKLIDSGVYSLADIGLIIGEILTKLEAIDGGSVRFVSREANYVAHMLVRIGLSITDDVVWIEDYPPCVERMIASEATA